MILGPCGSFGKPLDFLGNERWTCEQQRVVTLSSEKRDRDIHADLDISNSRVSSSAGDLHQPLSPGLIVTSAWDGGDMGCGELVMALRSRLKELPAGSILKVTATDAAAPEDLPAWCRLCGHKLVAMIPPHYYIQRQGD